MTQALVRRIRPLSRLALACAVALGAIAAQAAGDGGGGSGSSDGSSTPAPEVTKAVAAIKAERWNDAIAVLAPYVKRVRNDADAYNWLAYAYRKSGKLEPAFENYKRALSVQPGHLGAHEYIGEAYLMAGQPD
jgi:Tfp pilus assembly protein PilF